MIEIKNAVFPSDEWFSRVVMGMRNPMNSWDKSDSVWIGINEHNYKLGESDINLMRRLCSAGTEHRKFLRQLPVILDINAPLYWWKEFDTYKVGTTGNSCSTMHKIHSKPIELGDFSLEHVKLCDIGERFFDELEVIRTKYVTSGDKKYWYALIQLLPESYNQLRTETLNYEVLLNIYNQRKDHKLDEWREFCKWILDTVPYFKEITHLGEN